MSTEPSLELVEGPLFNKTFPDKEDFRFKSAIGGFGIHELPHGGGVTIILGAHTQNRDSGLDSKVKFRDFSWVQCVKTNLPTEGKTKDTWYYDGDIDGSPYYYTKDREETRKSQATKLGYDHLFIDTPSRPYHLVPPEGAYWEGELAFVGKRGSSFIEIIRVSYGFKISPPKPGSPSNITPIPPTIRHVRKGEGEPLSKKCNKSTM